jgi:uncharacterized PurR-regulated membrane protein YhhQ (DUF165 family)
MNTKQIILYAVLFAIFILSANYLVSVSINKWMNYGMIMYPLTFLLTDILSEKYQKSEVLKIVRIGSLIAIVPTIMLAGWLIAIASITTFVLIQQFDVSVFHYFKNKMQKQWWIRNNASTILAQFFDTIMFYMLAFLILPTIAVFIFGASKEWFFMPITQIATFIAIDYSIKVVLALSDTPIFWFFAIKNKVLIKN